MLNKVAQRWQDVEHRVKSANVIKTVKLHARHSPILIHARTKAFVSVVHSGHPLLNGTSVCMALLYKTVCELYQKLHSLTSFL